MKRPAVRATLLGLVLLAGSPLAWARAAPVIAVESGGIGLSRAAWESIHGPGNPGQSLVTYDNGTYAVGFQDDTVTFIEVAWPPPGLEITDAESAVRRLLPADARLDETFYAPATAGGPISLLLHRYLSQTLALSLAAASNGATGGILVIYQQTLAPDRFEPNVGRVSIAVGLTP